MGSSIPLRQDFDGQVLRRLAKATKKSTVKYRQPTDNRE